MIMTLRSKPHRSSASVVLLAALCLVGWAATPAVSSPPAAPVAPTESAALAAGPTPPVAVTAPLALAPSGADDDEKNAQSNRELRERMAKLQRHVEELSRKVENLTEMAERNAQRAAETAERIQRPVLPTPPRFERAGDAPLGLVTRSAGKVFSRKYSMPEGKLQAFTQLMARDDVPVLVSPGDDSITVQGTAEQHAIVGGFITIINRERKDETQAYELSEGKLKDLTELMIRNDVPIRVRPGDEKIQVIGTPAEQAIIKAFIDLIRPDTGDIDDLGAVGGDRRLLGYVQGQSKRPTEADRRQFEEATAQIQQDQAQRIRDARRTHQDAIKRLDEALARQEQNHDR